MTNQRPDSLGSRNARHLCITLAVNGGGSVFIQSHFKSFSFRHGSGTLLRLMYVNNDTVQLTFFF